MRKLSAGLPFRIPIPASVRDPSFFAGAASAALAPDPYRALSDRDLNLHPNTSKLSGDRASDVSDWYAHYYGMTEGLDIEWGRLMRALEESGQADNDCDVLLITARCWVACEASDGLIESTQVPFLVRSGRLRLVVA